MVPGQPQSALLFIPDISGFTQFVNETEIIHSQHIVKELLEILIETNQLNLQVGEIEGDAIFFYKLGDKPDLKSLLQQVEKMFTRFHQHLKLYDHQRICPCGACKTAVQLTLKVVAHFGEVTGIEVKGYKKLFGKAVILVHRLLKNNLDKREYVLFTDSLAGNSDHDNELPGWYNPEPGLENYDLGAVQFSFSDLSSLHDSIAPLNLPVHKFSSKAYVAFSDEEVIELSMEELFGLMIEQLQRGKWIKRQEIANDNSDENIYSLGSKHTCLLTGNSFNITESVKIETEKIELVEMNQTGIAGYRYTLKKISPGQSILSIQMLIKNNPFFRLGFFLIFKSKMMKRFHRFFTNLKTYLKMNAIPDPSP